MKNEGLTVRVELTLSNLANGSLYKICDELVSAGMPVKVDNGNIRPTKGHLEERRDSATGALIFTWRDINAR